MRTRGGKHFRHDPAHREKVPCRGYQLGIRGRQDADQSAMGFMGSALRKNPAYSLVSRRAAPRWYAVPGTRIPDHPRADRQGGSQSVNASGRDGDLREADHNRRALQVPAGDAVFRSLISALADESRSLLRRARGRAPRCQRAPLSGSL